MTELKTFMHAYHMPRVKCKRFLNSLNKISSVYKKEVLALAKERIYIVAEFRKVKSYHHMIYVGDKPGEGTNVGCGLINQSVTLNYKEFMEGGTNADQDVHSLS